MGTAGTCLDCRLEQDETDFQTGTASRFQVVGPAVGPLSRLTFRVDLSGFSPSWLLKQVEVRVRPTAGGGDDEAEAESGFWSATVDTWLSVQSNTELHVPLTFVAQVPSPSGLVKSFRRSQRPRVALLAAAASRPQSAAY